MVVRFAIVALLLLSATPAAVRADNDEMEGEAAVQQPEEPQGEAQEIPQEEAAPPVVQAQVQGQEEQEEQEEPVKIDDSAFEIHVFECVAPRGDPAPARKGPVPANSIMTLCFRPKNEGQGTTVKRVDKLDYAIQGEDGVSKSHASVRDNEAVEPMTRVVCPFLEDSHLCIAATKLGDMFFASASKVAAEGEIALEVAGEERTVPFHYEFSTAQAKVQAPIEHDYFEMPETPPGFPCAKEARIWLIMALLLTLLEFAFTPSSSSSDTATSSRSGNKKKAKITKVQ